jgi:hypothetical protein
MTDQSGKPERPPPKRNGPLKIDLPFEDAVKLALEAKPETGVGKAGRGQAVKRKT